MSRKLPNTNSRKASTAPGRATAVGYSSYEGGRAGRRAAGSGDAGGAAVEASLCPHHDDHVKELKSVTWDDGGVY